MAAAPPDKANLLATWRAHLLATRDPLVHAADAARAGTRVDGQHRPENRGERAAVTSQGYLSAALAGRLAELDAAIELLTHIDPSPRDRVVTGAVVDVEDAEGGRLRYAVLPGGDGSAAGGVRVISPASPIARALMGLGADESATVVAGGTEREVVVVEVW